MAGARTLQIEGMFPLYRDFATSSSSALMPTSPANALMQTQKKKKTFVKCMYRDLYVCTGIYSGGWEGGTMEFPPDMLFPPPLKIGIIYMYIYVYTLAIESLVHNT